MSDKRKVATDALETLGTIIGPNEKRDAIHLAVEPIVAGEALNPNDDVFLCKDGKAYKCSIADKGVGKVDPFLTAKIKKGQRFWLVIYPRQITSLRHVWSHPAFPDEPERSPVKINNTASVTWIMNFANTIGTTYKDLMEGAKEYAETEQTMFMGSNQEYENHWHEMDAFWNHFTAVTGIVPKEGGSFFRCGC